MPLGSLVGVDPTFVDPGRVDYRLLDRSPAIDAGSSSVPGGLSQADLAGLPRIAGARVDAGAHEHRPSARIIPVVTHARGFGGTPWRSDDCFYTNLGAVNCTATPCQARVRLRGRNGREIGSACTITIPAWEWLQPNELFAELGARPTTVASATVEVLTQGARAWFYASVVDRVTRDPTTVPLVVPGAERSSPLR